MLAAAPLERAARHAAQRARLVTRLAASLKTLEETVEMARITGLPLRTIANQAQGGLTPEKRLLGFLLSQSPLAPQAQMVRTENLLLRAARSQGCVPHHRPPAPR